MTEIERRWMRSVSAHQCRYLSHSSRPRVISWRAHDDSLNRLIPFYHHLLMNLLIGITAIHRERQSYWVQLSSSTMTRGPSIKTAHYCLCDIRSQRLPHRYDVVPAASRTSCEQSLQISVRLPSSLYTSRYPHRTSTMTYLIQDIVRCTARIKRDRIRVRWCIGIESRDQSISKLSSIITFELV